MALGIELRLS